MTPLENILAQHEELRAIMKRCEELADELDCGKGTADPLAREIVRLRIALDQHNRFEEQQLAPILRAGVVFPQARIDRMVDDHVEEHRLMTHRWALSPTAELRATLRMLREHLEAEEVHFAGAKLI